MVHYILLSSLLSIIGGLFYFGLLRNRLKVLHAKYTLLAIIILSWVIPFLVPSLPNYALSLEDEYLFDYSQYNQWNVVEIADPLLVNCYEIAQTSAEQCNCEIEQQSNILLYQSNSYYNFLIAAKTPIFWFFMFIMTLFFLDLIIKTICLAILVKKSKKTKKTLAGTTFYLLETPPNLPLAISSFTLFRHYIIWSAELSNKFSPEEIEGILLHEVAHLQQHDTWQQFLLYVLRLFWWLQPMYYLFKKELNDLSEYVADDFAVKHIGNAKAYAKMLIKAKELQIHQEKVSLAVAFAKSLFKQRVLRVIKEPKVYHKSNIWLSLSLIVVIFWATSSLTLPFLQQQNISIRQYEVLQQKNTLSGKIKFCKSCLIEDLKKEVALN